MPSDYYNPELNDSKKLSAGIRSKLRKEIENVALSYAVAFIDSHKIDEINILKASIMGMHQALDKLTFRPNHILVDGNKFFPYRDIPHTCVIKGDGKYISIAAASILAKTYRDELMIELHKMHSFYGWDRNKGYPTQYHRAAIMNYGITDFHRRSFHLIDTQTELVFKQDG